MKNAVVNKKHRRKKTMKRTTQIAVLFVLLLAAAFPARASEKSEANKKAALDFFQLILGDRNYEAARKYAGEYIQHDPRVGDGYDALVEALETNPLWKDRPKSKIEFKNVAADGDLVYLQTHKEIKTPDGAVAHLVVMHLFRFDDEGKIAEHWTLSQMAKLDESVSKHPLF
jgi:predicted SnoaL-like aldol condensation-catalyzing enzyme